LCRRLQAPRREILGSSFIRRVTQRGGVVPSCILVAYDSTHDEEDDPSAHMSLVHPATPAALSFFEDHMFPYMSRSANGLFGNYCPVVSRGGLVLLRRRHASSILDNLCVYDPITGRRTFLSNPPGIRPYQTRCFDRCVLLTAADGIGALLIPAIYALHRHQA
jgi:hypothetical protein